MPTWIAKMVGLFRPRRTNAPLVPGDPVAKVFALLDLVDRPRDRSEDARLLELIGELQVKGDIGRRWRRISHVAPAAIVVAEERHAALIADVSAGGFRVATRIRLAIDARVSCQVVSSGVRYCFPCRVSWHNPKNGWYGLAIDERPFRLATPPEVVNASSALLRRRFERAAAARSAS